MTTIDTHEPKTFSEILAIIEAFQENHEITWFRGVGNATHGLLPSIFRHPTKKTIEEIHSLEREITETFQQRSPPFVNQSFRDEWDTMFFMQHYGMPTRLLDWSESPFSALYFALTSGERGKDGASKQDAAIWMLDPVEWNRAALSDISYKGGVLATGHEQVKSYRPGVSLTERKNLPVMINGTHNSPRIVAQRGVFSLFGKSTDPMEKAYKDSKFPEYVIQKVVIKKDDVLTVAKSLFRKGISDTSIYPDLYGLSLEMKRSYGF
jgi:hypothetical protein